MPVITQRDMHTAWSKLSRALGRNTTNAWRSIKRDRRRIYNAVR